MSDPKTPTLELKLNEENEIGFKLNIEGTDPEIGSAKPKIRFTIIEGHTGRGWLFGTSKSEDGENICVTVPDMKGLVQENREYQGNLEVILGTRFFTPTKVDIRFIEPLKIEAAIITKAHGSQETLTEISPAPQEKPFSVQSEIDSVIVKEKRTQPKQTSRPAAKQTKPASMIKEQQQQRRQPATNKVAVSYSSLSDTGKAKVNEIFLSECKRRGIKNPGKYMKEGTSYTRKRLRVLIANATRQYLSKQKS